MRAKSALWLACGLSVLVCVFSCSEKPSEHRPYASPELTQEAEFSGAAELAKSTETSDHPLINTNTAEPQTLEHDQIDKRISSLYSSNKTESRKATSHNKLDNVRSDNGSTLHTSEPANTRSIQGTDQNKNKNGGESHSKRPRIALIVDDLGYNFEKVKRLTRINLPVTLALIPDTPHAKAVANHAKNTGFELMLHVPMETISERRWEQGLTNDMEKQQFDLAVSNMLKRFPNAKGINNHGGSLLTQQRDKMDWLMGELAEQELYFVDSRTISSSVAGKAAEAAGLAGLSRDVFLDNDRSHQAIEKELRRLQTIAHKQGQAIGIAHPYPETLEVLEKLLPKINSEGFEFVFVSQLTQGPS